MTIAVVADIHANLAALEAVLEDIQAHACTDVICLGDIVGYNAEPLECVRLVRQHCGVSVVGNHDHDMLERDPCAGTTAKARFVQAWTRLQLDDAALEYLRSLPGCHVDAAGFVAAHGCYLNEKYYYGYVTSTMLQANLYAVAARRGWPRIALCGHTHVAMASWLLNGEVVERRFDDGVRWPSQAEAVLLNPGSVGQPRDGDPRASYLLLEPPECKVELRRVAYDVARTAAQLKRHGLPAGLAQRLFEGR